MHPDTTKIAEHMRDFGLHVFGRSIVDVVFAEITSPYSHAMGAVRCAHAAELLIKARIAEAHPLLIFERLPKPGPDAERKLDIDALVSSGRTIMYSELPDVLWATTGYHISDIDKFQSFGRLRNAITHLTIPSIDLAAETLSFAFQVIEPFVRQSWEIDVVEFIEEYDCDCEIYLLEQLEQVGITYSRLGHLDRRT